MLNKIINKAKQSPKLRKSNTDGTNNHEDNQQQQQHLDAYSHMPPTPRASADKQQTHPECREDSSFFTKPNFQQLTPEIFPMSPSPPRSLQAATTKEEEEQRQRAEQQPNEQQQQSVITVGEPADAAEEAEASTHAPVLSNSPSMNTPISSSSSNATTQTKPRWPSTTDQMRLIDFRLLRTLGTGSFGRVHLAQSKHNGRYYAIKVLKKTEVVRLKQVNHTNNERSVLMNISHPFIVNLWGTFQDDANLYMVMDYVPGGELFSVLRRVKRFPDATAKFYAAQVLLALIYLHGQDVVYRDLKPENILLDASGNIKLTDFGFAKKVPDVTWTLCGTPDYLAPEVIQSKGYGKAVDYWSLGILIYEMLAGYPPFYDESQFRLYEKILTSKPTYPSHFDTAAVDLLQHLLTADLSSRYGNLRRGFHDVMEHPWFHSINFEKLLHRQLPTPHVPQLNSEGDASNFDQYQEEKMPYGIAQADPYRGYFAEF